MTPADPIRDYLTRLATHLADSRPVTLAAWRAAVDADPELGSPAALGRAAFNDHVPEVLASFEARLRGASTPATEVTRGRDMADHGVHRWQQGYQLAEVIREWGHLHMTLLNRLDEFEGGSPDVPRGLMAVARRELARLCADGVCLSASRYNELQQAGAAGRVRALELALADVAELDRRRAELLRETTHDLRGHLGVVSNTTAVLAMPEVTDPIRTRTLDSLLRGVGSLRQMLDDLMTLARLEAGYEQRSFVPFDAAEVLAGLCDEVRPSAEVRGLSLTADGPETLPVEGDPVKVRRIAQNLILNAVKYTRQGGVTVTWEVDPKEPDRRWVLAVQDTGPGLMATGARQLGKALAAATETAQEIGSGSAGPQLPESNPAAPSVGAEPPASEGIGLAIVKRLCELLDATIELDSERGVGTVFRVQFPRHTDGTLATRR